MPSNVGMKRTITLITFFLIGCIDAISCDCGRGVISVKVFNSNDWIFIGTLLSEEQVSTYPHRKCTYKIVTAYKGVRQGDTIEIYDAENVGACGLGRLTIGASYLMYARGNDLKWTSSCQENSRVPILVLPRDSIAINNIKTSRWRGEIDDTINTVFHGDTLFLTSHVPKVKNNSFQKFYDRDGKLSAEGRYKNGLSEGLWRYYERGELVEYGRYTNGKKDSLWVMPGGDIEEYKAGEFTYRQTSFVDGRLWGKTEPIEDGEKWIEYQYHDSSQPRFIAYANPPKRNDKGRLQAPVWDGPFKMFNKSGIVLQEGNKENGVEKGHWKYYYEDGKLRMEGSYIQLKEENDFLRGYKNGPWKIYYPNGRIKAVGEYKSGEKIGVWKFYDENGKEVPPDPKLIEEDEDWFTYSG